MWEDFILGQLHLVVVNSQMVSLHFLSVDPYGLWSFLTQYSIAVSLLLCTGPNPASFPGRVGGEKNAAWEEG